MILSRDQKEFLRAHRPPGTEELFAALFAADSAQHEAAVRYGMAALRKGNLAVVRPLMVGLCGTGNMELAAAIGRALGGRPGFEWLYGAFLGTEEIRSGDFRNGARLWSENESANRLLCDIPQWLSEPLEGKTVLIASGSPLLERNSALGFGDEILLARFAPELAKRGANVYLRSPPALYRLFQSLPSVKVLNGSCDTPRALDYCANPEQLPYLLECTRETLPCAPYLHADTLELPERGLKIGIAWGCSTVGPLGRYCSLSELSALAEIPGARLYSLEKSLHAEQLRPSPVGMSVVDLGAGFKDFYDTAAAINAMDVIVSTDNVVANLAGALGKPLFVLCAYKEFRWGDGGHTAWYPSATVLTKKFGEGWRGLVAQVVAELERWSAQ